MQSIRGTLVAMGFLLFTLPLMPFQWFLLAVNSKYRINFPRWYHQMVCRIIGLKVHMSGEFQKEGAVFLVSNHTSWLDITVLASVKPLSFVAKKEVAGWPLFGWLAKLQRTVFVDRQRKTASGKTTGEVASRLLKGDTIVLFAEGTSSDGNGVLPFKTALFAAAEVQNHAEYTEDSPPIYVQTAAIAYTRQLGLPLCRHGRPRVAWYGDMDLMDHMWGVFKGGPFDVHVKIGEPIAMDKIKDRKELAKLSEEAVRRDVVSLLRQG
ncbi:MAG: lysophospholipid acyltransferase family protein [Methyloligellaceae bacterium]